MIREVSVAEAPKILFVDDEVRIVNSLMGLFYNRYDVYTATDPEDALEILKKRLFLTFMRVKSYPISPQPVEIQVFHSIVIR